MLKKGNKIKKLLRGKWKLIKNIKIYLNHNRWSSGKRKLLFKSKRRNISIGNHNQKNAINVFKCIVCIIYLTIDVDIISAKTALRRYIKAILTTQQNSAYITIV